MNVGVVIPVGPGRRENLDLVLAHLNQQTVKPKLIVLVCDGEEAWLPDSPEILQAVEGVPLAVARAPKHEPGMEQPRNLGVRLLVQLPRQEPRLEEITHVWFLDSDILVEPNCLEIYTHVAIQHPVNDQPVMIGPYDWLAPGARSVWGRVGKHDDRWASFSTNPPWDARRSDLSMGLACFSGNLVWPIARFAEVGGFWNELHHGRCEDGELGLRAVGMGVPIVMVSKARGWHLDHPRNMQWIGETNAIDVPKIRERHPWKELGEGGEELFVVDEDGKRFNVRCHCGAEFNTAKIWDHRVQCTK